MPTTRSGRASLPAIAVIDSEDVLLAMIASGATSASICLRTVALMSMFSTMTSITSPTSRRPTPGSTASMRARIASRAVESSLPRATRLSRLAWICCKPRSSAAVLVSRR